MSLISLKQVYGYSFTYCMGRWWIFWFKKSCI